MESPLSDDERALLEAYRAVAPEVRAAVLALLRACVEQAKKGAAS